MQLGYELVQGSKFVVISLHVEIYVMWHMGYDISIPC